MSTKTSQHILLWIYKDRIVMSCSAALSLCVFADFSIYLRFFFSFLVATNQTVNLCHVHKELFEQWTVVSHNPYSKCILPTQKTPKLCVKQKTHMRVVGSVRNFKK